MRYCWLILCCLLISCSPQTSQQATFYVFGTTVKVILPDTDKKQAALLFTQIQSQLVYMHQRWHAWEESELTQINAACTTAQALQVTPQTKELILISQKYEQQSMGYFNPAIGGLLGQWGYLSNHYDEQRDVPEQDMIAALVMAQPSMQDISISGDTLICHNPQLRLDFGGIAKGYASNIIIDFLRSQNIHNALVDAGGDVQTLGQNKHAPWTVAVYLPGKQKPLTVLEVSNDESVFTSGSYERAINDEHHHLLNPKTGYPAKEFMSVTIIAHDPVLADAAATALSVSKQSDWQVVADNLGVQAAILITVKGDIIITPAMKQYMSMPVQALD